MLLSLVSSAFPPAASAANMLGCVDEELAFLSILPPVAGFEASAVVSESTEAPYPTLSTKVKLASLYRRTDPSATMVM